MFYYDSQQTSGLCEAVHLCTEIPVTLLVSLTNLSKMQKLCEELPKSLRNRIEIKPLYLMSHYLNTERVKTLMAVGNDVSAMPLYMQVVIKTLRDMAIQSQGSELFNYPLFRAKLQESAFTDKQSAPLQMRLTLLESFMNDPPKLAPRKRWWTR
jgi:hypothetical protein